MREGTWAINGFHDGFVGVALYFGDDYILSVGEETLHVLKGIAHLSRSTHERDEDLSIPRIALRISDRKLQ